MDALGAAIFICLFGGLGGIYYAHGHPDRKHLDGFFGGVFGAGMLLIVLAGLQSG
jgi:hypothetical protein